MFLGTGLGFLGVALAEGIWRRWGGSIVPGWRARHASLLGEAEEPLKEKIAV